MDTVKDAEEMSMLAKQKTTHSPHGVFDASQFKHQVDRDVSSDVIEQLQKEFGNDLAGGKKLIELRVYLQTIRDRC